MSSSVSPTHNLSPNPPSPSPPTPRSLRRSGRVVDNLYRGSVFWISNPSGQQIHAFQSKFAVTEDDEVSRGIWQSGPTTPNLREWLLWFQPNVGRLGETCVNAEGVFLLDRLFESCHEVQHICTGSVGFDRATAERALFDALCTPAITCLQFTCQIGALSNLAAYFSRCPLLRIVDIRITNNRTPAAVSSVSSAEDFDSRATGTTDEERNAHISQADAAALFCALGGLKLLQSIRLCSEDLLVSQQAVSPLLNFVRTTQAKDINLELPRPEDVPLDEYGYLCGQIADALETQTFKVIQLLVTVLDDRFGRALSGNKHLRTLMVTVRPHIVNVRHNAATAGNGFFHNLRNLARLTVLHYVDTSPLNVASLLDLTYRSPIETLYLAQQNISEGDLKLLTKGLARCTSLRSVLSASWKGRDMPCHIIYPSDEDFDDTSELEFGELESEFPERRSDDDDSDEDLRHRGTLANTPIRNTNA